MLPGMTKRQKELARAQRQKEKAQERARRREEKAKRPPSEGDVDPDIAHIVPGPQPVEEDLGG